MRKYDVPRWQDICGAKSHTSWRFGRYGTAQQTGDGGRTVRATMCELGIKAARAG